MPREHPLALHRILPLGLVALLALLAVAAYIGPKWFQRLYHPLEYREVIGDAARRADVDPYMLLALVHAESGFDADVESSAGAVGLTQVMPETAEDVLESRGTEREVTSAELKDPRFNTEIGAEYLAQLRRRYDDDSLALAAYNAGMVAGDRWKKAGGPVLERIDFPQTRHYVEKVLAERETYRKLYPEA